MLVNTATTVVDRDESEVVLGNTANNIVFLFCFFFIFYFYSFCVFFLLPIKYERL